MDDPISEANFLSRYQDRAHSRDWRMFQASDALEILEAARRRDLRLAGVDGFHITKTGARQPDQEFSNDIVDFDGTYETFVEETRRLITSGAESAVWFELVFEDE